jgi:rare lipoprotein A
MKIIKTGILTTLLLTSASVFADTVSWYGKPFHGRKTANGETYNMYGHTTASNSHKMGTVLKVTNISNGKSVVVKVNDTGNFSRLGRTLDLSKAAFAKIAPLGQGTCKVKIEKL